MDAPTLQAEIGRLSRDIQTLAATGALLRLRRAGTCTNPAAVQALEDYVEATLPDTVGRLDEDQAAFALAFIDLFVEEAADLLRHPDPAPGWKVDDSELLQTQGRLSRQGFIAMEAIGDAVPAFRAALDGCLLDVGTGVGGIVLEAVERRPTLTAVAIDIWEPALTLARRNVAASAHADRIEIRRQDVRDLDDRDAFDVIWMPPMFFGKTTAEAALDRFAHAVRAGGFVVLGHHALPPDPAAAAFSRLRTARAGGHVWSRDDIENALRSRGFVEVGTVSPMPQANFVVGRRP